METNEQTTGEELARLSEVRKVRRDKLEALKAAGQDPFQIVTYDQTHETGDLLRDFEALEGQTVRIAGRLMSKRVMGKASFAHVQDMQGRMQIYVRREDLGDDAYAAFKKLDIGDIVGVEGIPFLTKTGEKSVHAHAVTLLSKSLQPLPEKFHGLKDMDLRYRERYLDLIMNPEVKDTFKMRSQIQGILRRVLLEKGFLEVETPTLHMHATNAAARPFRTHHNTLDIDMVLRVELELYLKRLIIGGLDRVFEMGRIFRNEGMSYKHNPEFTMLELYQAYTDYHGMMDICEELFTTVSREVKGGYQITYDGTEIDLTPGWTRLTMIEAVKKYSGVDFDTIQTDEEAKAAADKAGIEYNDEQKRGDIINLFFEEYCEEKLIQPTFIYDYPIEISPLAKRTKYDPRLTERFEVFVYGREMGNAFTELNDPVDQRERFIEQAKKKNIEGEFEIDEDFVYAMEHGMPPTGGLGMGVDRMIMLFTDSPGIRDVLLFPTMKPLDNDKKVEKVAETPAEAAPVAPEKIDFSNVVIEPLFEEFVDFETFSKSDFRAVKVLECEAVPKSKKLLKFTLDDGTGVNRTILSGIHAFYEPEELVGKTLIAITNLPPRPMMGIDSCGMLLSAINKRGEEEELHLLMVDNHIPAGAKLY
ncbi:MAG: lysine--tRNA ligase [Eubacteriales bacterium]|nr:lysine--tRNA ligase [Eubacteriales bacterium]